MKLTLSIRNAIAIGLALLAFAGATYNPRQQTTFDVSTLATSGVGTRTDPWAGWDAKVSAIPEFRSVYLPNGYYRQSRPLRTKIGWKLYGDSEYHSWLLRDTDFEGPSIACYGPINSHTRGFLRIEDIAVISTRSVKPAKGIEIVGLSGVYVEHVNIQGFERGLVLDQAERVWVDKCNFEANVDGVLVANGSTNTPGAHAQYTNGIWISNSDFNNEGVAIEDQGGYCHHYDNLHVYGGARVGYFSSVQAGSFRDSYTESQSDTLFKLTNLTADGKLDAGRCNCFDLANNFTHGNTVQVDLTCANYVRIAGNLFSGKPAMAIIAPKNDSDGDLIARQGNMVGDEKTRLMDAGLEAKQRKLTDEK